jgi:lysozyme
MPVRKVNKETVDLIKRWEGFRAEPYKCPAGVDTIGYGHTATKSLMKRGTKITEARAEKLLRSDLAIYEKAISEMVEVDLTDGQFGALVSWCFNVGVGAAQRSTLIRKLNAGDYDNVPKELARWNKIGNSVSSGLANRRAAETGLWARGGFVSSTTGEEIVEATAGLAGAVSSNTAKGAVTVATISAAGTALSQLEPVIGVMGGMSPWLVGVLILAALASVIIWRAMQE